MKRVDIKNDNAVYRHDVNLHQSIISVIRPIDCAIHVL